SAIITIPAYLYEPINASFIRKIEHICDAVVEIESFAVDKSLDNLINNNNALMATIATATTLQSLLRFARSPTLSPTSGL
ncbi:4931_t:CDS:2, partial [Entrophospora sp. SA101]